MPLVIFNYNQSVDAKSTQTLENYVQKIQLPRYALDKRWKLLSVNAINYNNARDNFQTFEFRIPELMKADNVIFVTQGEDVPKPEDSFRFYVKHHQLANTTGGIRNYACFSAVDEKPNFDLGMHSGDSEELTLIATARKGNGSRAISSLSSYSIILEYEE